MSEIIILRSDTDVSTKKGVFWDFDRNGKRQGLLYLDETPLPRHYDEDGKEDGWEYDPERPNFPRPREYRIRMKRIGGTLRLFGGGGRNPTRDVWCVECRGFPASYGDPLENEEGWRSICGELNNKHEAMLALARYLQDEVEADEMAEDFG